MATLPATADNRTVPLNKLILPIRRSGKSWAPKIHYERPDGQMALCGQAKVYGIVDGEKMRIWYRTKRPVNCKPCTRILAATVKQRLGELTGEQLEDIIAHLDTFRTRFGAART